MLRKTHTKLMLCDNRAYPHLLKCYVKKWHVDYVFPFVGRITSSQICPNEFWVCTDPLCKLREKIEEGVIHEVWPDSFEWIRIK